MNIEIMVGLEDLMNLKEGYIVTYTPGVNTEEMVRIILSDDEYDIELDHHNDTPFINIRKKRVELEGIDVFEELLGKIAYIDYTYDNGVFLIYPENHSKYIIEIKFMLTRAEIDLIVEDSELYVAYDISFGNNMDLSELAHQDIHASNAKHRFEEVAKALIAMIGNIPKITSIIESK